MKGLFPIFRYSLLLVMAVFLVFPLYADKREDRQLMDSLLHAACTRGRTAFADISEYDARLYVRCRMNTHKRNVLIKVIPSMFKFKSGQNAYIAETNNELHYTAPNIYDRKINEIAGTFPNLRTQPDIFTDYFYINIYSTTLLEDRLLSPLAIENKSYYRYKLDDYASTDSKLHIIITPKRRNTQLVRGELCLDRTSGLITSIKIYGEYDLLHFTLQITMGQDEATACLPVEYKGEIDFKFAGNKLSGNYLAHLEYNHIKTGYIRNKENLRKRLDLTQSYKLSTESSRFLKSPQEFQPYRLVALDTADSLVYDQAVVANDSVDKHKDNSLRKRRLIWWGKLGELMLNSHRFNMTNASYIKVSPILNPVLLSYNSTYGYSYRVDLPLQFMNKKGQSLEVFPRIGYNFTNKQFYWRITGTVDYYPQKQANLVYSIGNGERIYNSSVLDKLKNETRENIDFNKLNLEYFNDFHWDFSNRIELFNGLHLTTGIIYHQRSPFEKSEIGYDFNTPFSIRHIKTTYVSFAPHVRVEFTPRQYYYYNHYRKINTSSPYPTFSLDWERGLKHVLKSSIEYERFEFEINYKLQIKSLRSILARIGYGFFTKQSDVFFVEYANFSRYGLPYGWEDEMGGMFHLLDRWWYNSSTNYARANFIYESPMMLLTRISGITRYIQQERIYLNLLKMNNIKFYWEAGYGFATHIFDIGLFINNFNGKFDSFGCKFTFELFRK